MSVWKQRDWPKQIIRKEFAAFFLLMVMCISSKMRHWIVDNYFSFINKPIVFLVPHIFSLVFAVVKPFLNQATLDKIRVFGFDKSEWQAALLEEIEPNQLPAYYGGTVTDPDGNPMCLNKVLQFIFMIFYLRIIVQWIL